MTLRDGTGDTYDAIGYNVNKFQPGLRHGRGAGVCRPEGGFPPVGRDLEVTAATEGPG